MQVWKQREMLSMQVSGIGAPAQEGRKWVYRHPSSSGARICLAAFSRCGRYIATLREPGSHGPQPHCLTAVFDVQQHRWLPELRLVHGFEEPFSSMLELTCCRQRPGRPAMAATIAFGSGGCDALLVMGMPDSWSLAVRTPDAVSYHWLPAQSALLVLGRLGLARVDVDQQADRWKVTATMSAWHQVPGFEQHAQYGSQPRLDVAPGGAVVWVVFMQGPELSVARLAAMSTSDFSVLRSWNLRLAGLPSSGRRCLYGILATRTALVLSSALPEIRVYSASHAPPQVLGLRFKADLGDQHISQDGLHICGVRDPDTVQILDLRTGACLVSLQPQDMWPQSPKWQLSAGRLTNLWLPEWIMPGRLRVKFSQEPAPWEEAPGAVMWTVLHF